MDEFSVHRHQAEEDVWLPDSFCPCSPYALVIPLSVDRSQLFIRYTHRGYTIHSITIKYNACKHIHVNFYICDRACIYRQ